MANGLSTYVHVVDKDGQPCVFGPDDPLPEWAVEKIGPHCFEGGLKPTPKPVRRQKEAGDG